MCSCVPVVCVLCAGCVCVCCVPVVCVVVCRLCVLCAVVCVLLAVVDYQNAPFPRHPSSHAQAPDVLSDALPERRPAGETQAGELSPTLAQTHRRDHTGERVCRCVCVCDLLNFKFTVFNKE